MKFHYKSKKILLVDCKQLHKLETLISFMSHNASYQEFINRTFV